MNGLQILGTGRALPEHVVTNDDLAKIVDTSDEWIVSRTGIKERRFAREGENLTQFAVEAARQAIARAGIRPEDLGLCLMGTVTSDNATPAQSCLVHQALRLPEDCPAFDLSAGCSGFLYAMETAASVMPCVASVCAPTACTSMCTSQSVSLPMATSVLSAYVPVHMMMERAS